MSGVSAIISTTADTGHKRFVFPILTPKPTKISRQPSKKHAVADDRTRLRWPLAAYTNNNTHFYNDSIFAETVIYKNIVVFMDYKGVFL